MVRLRRLARDPAVRRAEGVFVVEGPKLVWAALEGKAPVESVFVTPDQGQTEGRGEGLRDLIAQAGGRGVPVYQIAPEVLRRAADAVTPQPVLAVAGQLDVPLAEIRSCDPVLVCVDVRDPGNLGAILRTAEATGMGAVICCKGTVDVYNPKCVRASAGALFHLPVVAGLEAGQVLETLGRWGRRRLAAEATGGVPPEQFDLRRPTALVLGNEGHGLPGGLAPRLDGRVTIPMAGTVESLNVSIAAAVLCFEAARQRRTVAE